MHELFQVNRAEFAAQEEAVINGHSSAEPITVPNTHFKREVYCVLGIPIDAVNLDMVVSEIEYAAVNRLKFLISTPNLNFLVNSLSDAEFRQSLLDSDLCPPDGTPLIWISRLLGLPIKQRAAGADLLDRLQAPSVDARRLTMFLFGGSKGAAIAAAKAINAKSTALNCVGTLDPGFGDVPELSREHVISSVNASEADFLVVSLGAKKGQLWLHQNRDRITIPVRSHLGAALNFQGGIIKRAPANWRRWGLEWVWRIKEERYLWKRYQHDGLVLLRLLATRVMPLAALTKWQEWQERRRPRGLVVEQEFAGGDSVTIKLSGSASKAYLSKAVSFFDEALTFNKNIVIDLSKTCALDSRFLGLLMLLQRELRIRGTKLFFTGLNPAIRRTFRLNELGYLLAERS